MAGDSVARAACSVGPAAGEAPSLRAAWATGPNKELLVALAETRYAVRRAVKAASAPRASAPHALSGASESRSRVWA